MATWSFPEEFTRFAREGVDKVGFARAESFAEAPAGARPADQMPACRSVIVFAIKHLDVFTLTSDLACQAYSQDLTNHEAMHQAYRLSRFLEGRGFAAFPMVGSVTMWPFAERETAFGRISLKHAAVFAGLGRFGRNGMLLTPEFGPRVQLAAILTDADLPASGRLASSPCTGCDQCVQSCPAGALRTPAAGEDCAPVDAERCQGWRRVHGGESPLGYADSCGLCRAVCPVGRPGQA